MKIKVCGIKHNIQEVATLQPDYMGFIFYEKSLRFFQGTIPTLKATTKKVGVFVDAPINFIIETIKVYQLDVIQLHGDESVHYCKNVHSKIDIKKLNIWKVFSVKDTFDFSILKVYEPYVSHFLFDTKGKQKGGNGYRFNWSLLKNYASKKPFIISGGIGIEHITELQNLKKSKLPVYAVDVNSKLEIEPGLKNIEKLKKLKDELSR